MPKEDQPDTKPSPIDGKLALVSLKDAKTPLTGAVHAVIRIGNLKNADEVDNFCPVVDFYRTGRDGKRAYFAFVHRHLCGEVVLRTVGYDVRASVLVEHILPVMADFDKIVHTYGLDVNPKAFYEKKQAFVYCSEGGCSLCRPPDAADLLQALNELEPDKGAQS